MVCLLLASDDIANGSGRIIALMVGLLAWTIYRTYNPLRYVQEPYGLIQVLTEVGLTTLAVISTGYWESPLAFSLLTATSLAGFARGFGFGLRIAVVTIAAVSLPEALEPNFTSDEFRTQVQWSVEILLVALVTGYSRHISGAADLEHSLALDRLSRLADANSLLFSLHQLAQTLPASLDLDEVLDETLTRLHDLFDYEASALLLRDDTDRRWLVARREGVKLAERLTDAELAPPLRRALVLNTLVAEGNLLEARGHGVSGRMASGLYALLTARGSTIGLLALEHSDPDHFGARDREMLAGFVEPAALAIDNARWFNRLRTVGADEERTRIARDLHDRIGQSLAYLAFELDRIRSRVDGTEAARPVDQLRDDVRNVIREVRDTLYDLRTDVSDAHDLPTTLRQFLERVGERSGLNVSLRTQEDERLPLRQEREVWRIAQEAVANVERHAKAENLTVLWRCDPYDAVLEIADDGVGFPIKGAGRLDSYGLLGMRERADSIGARLEVVSSPGKGTKVRCYLQRN